MDATHFSTRLPKRYSKANDSPQSTVPAAIVRGVAEYPWLIASYRSEAPSEIKINTRTAAAALIEPITPALDSATVPFLYFGIAKPDPARLTGASLRCPTANPGTCPLGSGRRYNFFMALPQEHRGFTPLFAALLATTRTSQPHAPFWHSQTCPVCIFMAPVTPFLSFTADTDGDFVADPIVAMCVVFGLAA